MNRAVVRAATAAVAGWLVDGGGTMDVVVGCDARHRSDEFADEVAQVLAGAGIRVHLLPRPGRRRCSRSPCATWAPARAS